MTAVMGAPARALAGLLEQRTGQHIATSRIWRIETALKPVMREAGISSLDMLASRVAAGIDPRLTSRVVEALLNNETFFFRDQAVFDLLFRQAIEPIRMARASSRRLRIWCAGCSTGQEAWSLAMLFAEARERWRDWTVDIVATDVSSAAIERARRGVYSQFEIQRGLPVTMMLKWFEQGETDWRIKPELARRVRFMQHNLLDGPPVPGRFDVVLCRNVLLYFDAQVRKRVFERLADTLADDGILMLGAGETVIGQTERFAASKAHRGLYVATPHKEARSAA